MTPHALTKFGYDRWKDGFNEGWEAGLAEARKHPQDTEITRLMKLVNAGKLDLDEAIGQLVGD